LPKNLKQHFDWVGAQAPWLRPCSRPQKMFPDRKIRPVMPVLPSHAGNWKKTDFLNWKLKKKTFLVLRPQFFKSLRPS